MKAHRNLLTLFALTCALAFSSATTFAQTTTFTYQGKLNDAGVPANAAYDMQFKAFDALTSGNQFGSTVTNPSVQVTNGIFTLELDFGALTFRGQDVYLEIAVRPSGNPNPYTLLLPRQRVTSAPYAIQSLNAITALSAGDALNLGGTPANLYVQTGDSRMSDARPPTAGSPNYLQNTTAPQAVSNFNISGNGTAGGTVSANAVNSATQYNIGGICVLSIGGTNNTFVGVSTGALNTTGQGNSFFGSLAGATNTGGTSNSFFGRSAGTNNSSGGGNSFFGSQAGQANTTATLNSFFGSSAGFLNTTGDSDSFFGFSAGGKNTTGFNNSFFGTEAGGANTTADGDSFFGRSAGKLNTTGKNNSFFGYSAGSANTTGQQNAFYGVNAGSFNTTASDNAFFGFNAGEKNTAPDNSFFGSLAGANNVNGVDNSFFGKAAGLNNAAGQWNSFFGSGAGTSNTSGTGNSFFGFHAAQNNVDGDSNVFVGMNAGQNLSTGIHNTFIGVNAGQTSTTATTGDNNTLLGYNAKITGGPAIHHSTAIGADAVVDFSNVIVLGTIDDQVNVSGHLIVGKPSGGKKLIVDKIYVGDLSGGGNASLCSDGQGLIGSCSSSLRYKTNFAPYTRGFDIINLLRPITFDWKNGGMHDVGFGAEDVEKIDPLLVTYNKSGQVEGVKYDRISVVLVNAIKGQQTQIAAQQKQIEDLNSIKAENARLKAQLVTIVARLERVETKRARRK